MQRTGFLERYVISGSARVRKRSQAVDMSFSQVTKVGENLVANKNGIHFGIQHPHMMCPLFEAQEHDYSSRGVLQRK